MEIHLTPEIAAKLTHSAAQKGRAPDEFVRDVLAQYLDDEAQFIEAVSRGEEALQSGNYLTHEQVGQRLARFLHT